MLPRLLLTIAIAVPLLAAPARAHIVQEDPWNPVAAAWRASIFMADLAPPPWEKIRANWTEPYPNAVSETPAAAIVDAAPILAAIAAEDRDALYAASTRALSGRLRATLEEAAEGDDPHGAIRRAEALYRAFDGFIRQADPAGWRDLGRAWLTVNSAAPARGVLGAGASPGDPEAFRTAIAEMDAYFRANFEPETFTPRPPGTVTPETVAAASGPVRIAPWLPPGSFIGDQTPLPRLVLNFEEQGIDEADLPLVAYGDMLFDSPVLFGEPARSLGLACSTCHNRSDVNRDFFIPGVSHRPGGADVDGGFFNPIFNDRRDDHIDAPSLRGLRFTGPYGRDGREGSLRDFVRTVIVGEFNGPEPTPFMLDALVAYLLEFDWLPNAMLTAEGALTGKAPEAARRGEAIFKRPFAGMDGMACATCHIPSGNFLDKRAHDIGSAAPGYEGARAGTFDTPTLLGAAHTAPYFHDGSLPTLASVVDWFDAEKSLDLTEAEKADLTAYLETVGAADEPYEAFDERNTPFRLAFEELTTFATTLDHLIPARDAFHARLLIDTVAGDLSADASAMSNLAAKQEAYALAEALEAVGAAVDLEDWPAAEARWTAFKQRKEAVDAEMY